MNEGQFVTSLRSAHKFFTDLGIAEPLMGPTSLPVSSQFNKVALDTELPYADVFFEGLRIGHYNFQLTDYSFFQFSYKSQDEIRYAFYPSPFTSLELEKVRKLHKTFVEGTDQDVELFFSMLSFIKVNYRRPIIRYEYNLAQYVPGVHPVSHMHIGTYGDDRWPILPRLSPLAFALFVGKLYFRSLWEIFTEVKNDTRFNELDDLLERERGHCFVTPSQMFSIEQRSFHLI